MKKNLYEWKFDLSSGFPLTYFYIDLNQFFECERQNNDEKEKFCMCNNAYLQTELKYKLLQNKQNILCYIRKILDWKGYE